MLKGDYRPLFKREQAPFLEHERARLHLVTPLRCGSDQAQGTLALSPDTVFVPGYAFTGDVSRDNAVTKMVREKDC